MDAIGSEHKKPTERNWVLLHSLGFKYDL